MVIDSTDRQRLGISRDELHCMLTHEELSRACLLVYANKQVINHRGSLTFKTIRTQRGKSVGFLVWLQDS